MGRIDYIYQLQHILYTLCNIYRRSMLNINIYLYIRTSVTFQRTQFRGKLTKVIRKYLFMSSFW